MDKIFSGLESLFIVWLVNFFTVIDEVATQLSIPASAIQNLRATYTIYSGLYAQATGSSSTSVIIAEKNSAKEVLIAELRQFIPLYISKNIAISDAILVLLKLPVPDKTYTHHGKPAERPSLTTHPKDNGLITVTVINPLTETKKKPLDANRVMIKSEMRSLDTPNDWIFREMITGKRTAVTFVYDIADAGRAVRFSACYLSPSDVQGIWSGVAETVVP